MTRRRKILCLHGSRQLGSIFEQRIESIRSKLSGYEWVCIDAGIVLPRIEGQSASTRAWWRHEGLTCAAVSVDDMLRDWATSCAAIRSVLDECGDFVGVLGFSQGAAAASVLAALAAESTSSSLPSMAWMRCVIFAGGYRPEPFDQFVAIARAILIESADVKSSLSSSSSSSLSLPSLHFFSAGDTAVPIAQSLALADTFQNSVRVPHDQGHAVPQKAAHITSLASFLTQHAPELFDSPILMASLSLDAPPPPNVESSLHPWYMHNKPYAPLEAMDAAFASLPPHHVDEMEAIRAIFMDQFVLYMPRVDNVNDASSLGTRLGISLASPHEVAATDGEQPLVDSFSLSIHLPPSYPSCLPLVHVHGPLDARHPKRMQLDALIHTTLEASLHQPVVFVLVETVRDFIATHVSEQDVSLTSRDNKQANDGASHVHAVGIDGDPLRLTASHWCMADECDVEAMRHAMHVAAIAPQPPPPPLLHASARVIGSRWNYTIGLIGKPSAGKSTLFNASTAPASEEDGAKVAAYPFTTIEPNLGRGYFAIPCPCRLLMQQHQGGDEETGCGAGFGHVAFRPTCLPHEVHRLGSSPFFDDTNDASCHYASCAWRRVPIVIKDVAGLVPGAYQGRGRGNAFLNDLLDADVLVHVMDISGTTDQEGNAVHVDDDRNGNEEAAAAILDSAQTSPLVETQWIREEVHRWIFDNVKTKWQIIVRRPERLRDMFSGYHASPLVVERALASVGLTGDNASLVRLWSEGELHQLVANFCRLRFPILIAMNKADVPRARERIAALLQALPHEPCVAMSAASEVWLVRQRRLGFISYQDGASMLSISPHAPDDVRQRAELLVDRVLKPLGGTGVLAALTAAVALKPPACIFPVADLTTLRALRPLNHVKDGVLDVQEEGGGEEVSVAAAARLAATSRIGDSNLDASLRDVLLLHQGSNVDHVYQALKKPPLAFVEGDFVRAEGLILHQHHHSINHVESQVDIPVRPYKKDEVVSWHVLRIMTNRKMNWQADKRR